MKLQHTEKSGLTLHKIEGFNGSHGRGKNLVVWKHKDSEGVAVGPSYESKALALNDTEDYAVRAGWIV